GRRPVEGRIAEKEAFADAVDEWTGRMDSLRVYSMTGVRSDCDFFLWKITERYDDLGELGTALNGTALAGWLETTYSYLATTKASQYTSARKARKITPHGLPYLVVYPFTKVRPWYALPEANRPRPAVYDERRPRHVQRIQRSRPPDRPGRALARVTRAACAPRQPVKGSLVRRARKPGRPAQVRRVTARINEQIGARPVRLVAE